MKRVLMIAFHFPPCAGGSGLQRTLRFVQHLPAFGWEPVVLTAHRMAYERIETDPDNAIPDGVCVTRALAFDAARHFSIGGRYPLALASPDRWMTWRYAAVRSGLELARAWRPDVIWSTYPIPTAHVIANTLRRRTGLRWVADFRDPMAQIGYPEHPRTWRKFKQIEETVLRNARFSVFTTAGAARTYRINYPEAREKIRVIENGFDEDTFAALKPAATHPLTAGAITLVHSGVIYPSERDPSGLFRALAAMAAAGTIVPGKVHIRFRAAVHDQLLVELARRYAVEQFIEVLPSVPYAHALEEMMRADGLLVLQASNCNEQIPAKLYEYLRAGRPIVGLTDPDGDTAHALRAAGAHAVARLDAPEEIAEVLARFLGELADGKTPSFNEHHVSLQSRRNRSESLAHLLDEASAERPS